MVNDQQIEQKLTGANPVPHPEHLHEDPSEARALFALILARRDAMTVTKQPTPTRPSTDRRRRPALVAAAAAVLVLVLVGIAAFIGRGDGEEDVTDQSVTTPVVEDTLPPVDGTRAPTTIPAAETTVPVAPAATLLDGTWVRTTRNDGFIPADMAETAFGLIAAAGPDGIWLSEDGSDWRQVMALPRGEVVQEAIPPSEGSEGEPALHSIEAYASEVVEYHSNVYVFAVIAEGLDAPSPTIRPVVFSSTDGTTWSESPFAEPRGVAIAGEHELLVVAEDGATVYRTEDGSDWTRHETPLGVNGLESIAYVDGEYLAFVTGPDTDEFPEGERTMVRSSDGIDWEPIPGSGFPFDAHPRGIIQFGDTLYTGGLLFDGGFTHAMIWRSTDGSTWQPAELPEIPGLVVISDFIPSKYGLLALGQQTGEITRIVPLTTTDGSTFVVVPNPDDVFIGTNGIPLTRSQGVAIGDGIVLRGQKNPWDGTIYQWTWTPNG